MLVIYLAGITVRFNTSVNNLLTSGINLGLDFMSRKPVAPESWPARNQWLWCRPVHTGFWVLAKPPVALFCPHRWSWSRFTSVTLWRWKRCPTAACSARCSPSPSRTRRNATPPSSCSSVKTWRWGRTAAGPAAGLPGAAAKWPAWFLSRQAALVEKDLARALSARRNHPAHRLQVPLQPSYVRSNLMLLFDVKKVLCLTFCPQNWSAAQVAVHDHRYRWVWDKRERETSQMPTSTTGLQLTIILPLTNDWKFINLSWRFLIFFTTLST